MDTRRRGQKRQTVTVSSVDPLFIFRLSSVSSKCTFYALSKLPLNYSSRSSNNWLFQYRKLAQFVPDMPKIINSTTAEGVLRKESHDILKQWQERYFVLDAARRRLIYYVDYTKKQMKGEYELSEKSTVIEGFSLNPFSFCKLTLKKCYVL